MIKIRRIIIENRMSNLHFIKAPCHQSSRPQGYQFAPNEIKEQYDYEIDPKLFDGSTIDMVNDEIKLCEGYNVLYEYISKYSKENPEKKIITIGGDHSISASTIVAMNEKYMRREDENHFTSDLIVLWIDPFPDITDFSNSATQDLNEMPCASILGLCDSKFTKHKLNVWPDQVIYFGLLKEEITEFITNNNIKYFTSKKITDLDPDIIISAIKDMVGERPVHVSLDLKVFNKDIVKCVNYENKNGLEIKNVEKLLVGLKNNIVSMDITEFNPLIGSVNDVRICKDLVRYLLKKTFDIKEKSINVFTEHSQFLIYRPMDQEDPETDIGWFILRGIELECREELIKIIPDDTIITIDIDINQHDEMEPGTYLITKTTINEQNEKSYYVATTINDIALYPQEKATMMFELVNSSK